MSDQSATNLPPVLGVSELAQAVRRLLEGSFDYVRVRGEISQPKIAASGHCYLRLKDAEAVLDAVIWRPALARLGIKPEEGIEVIATGRLSSYPARSSYQLIIERMELAGEGALLKMIEERKRRLAAEGLFDAARKKPLPYLPATIGVVTSPTGAVIRDILHRLADRFPRHVLLWPVQVQGEGAAAQIAAAIEGFNRIQPGGPVPRPDLLIVARGGGSLEDLMAFNDEAVVRAAAASRIPLIAGVGHETDTTLIDFAADRRAPTPTAAAEMAVPVRAELLARLQELRKRTDAGWAREFRVLTGRVEGMARGLPEPRTLLGQAAQLLDDRAERMQAALARGFERRNARLAQIALRLPTPAQQLDRAALRLAATTRALGQAMRALARHAAERGTQAEKQLASLGGRLIRAAAGALRRAEERVRTLGQLLEGYAPTRVLERGYALVLDAAGQVVASAAAARPGAEVTLRFHDGAVPALLGSARHAGRPGRPKDSQGTLL